MKRRLVGGGGPSASEPRPIGRSAAAPAERPARGQRGSALVLALMVLVLASGLGLSLALLSDREQLFAERNTDAVQVEATAAAGIQLVVSMMRSADDHPANPVFGTDYSTEADLNAMGIHRTTRGNIGTRYAGSNDVLFAGPYDQVWSRTFGGVRDEAAGVDDYDIRFDCLDADGDELESGCWLEDEMNALLRASADPRDDRHVGRVTQVSVYGPPTFGGDMYGVATIRVEAEKRDGEGLLLARRTRTGIVAIVGAEPAILVDGDLLIESSTRACGNGCMTIHANGNMVVESSGNYSGGDPTLSATGTIAAASSTVDPEPEENADEIPPPPINPWDLLYRPATSAGLAKYYMFTSRPPHAFWRDDDPSTVTAPYDCGTTQCQDYGSEYQCDVTGAHTATARARTSTGYVYKWDEADRNWDLLTTVSDGNTFSFNGYGFYFDYTADLDVSGATDTEGRTTADDAADLPFNTDVVPRTFFKVDSSLHPNDTTEPIQGVTILVDGGFWIGSSAGQGRSDPSKPPWIVSVAAVGTIYLGSSSELDPALENQVLFASGRDIWIESSLNNSLTGDFCDTPSEIPADSLDRAAAVFAAHEQLRVQSSSKTMGIIVVENEVNFDNDRDTGGFKTFDIDNPAGSGPLYIDSSSRFAYKCGVPDWPFAANGRPTLIALGGD